MQEQYEMMLHTTLEAYSQGIKNNDDVYAHVANTLNIELETCIKPIGKALAKHNILTRKVRWLQQTLKSAGAIKRIGRGQWKLTKEGKFQLARINTDRHLVAASTEIGLIIWGDSVNVFDKVITEDIHLVVTSPPYLGIQRSYGTQTEEQAYIDMIIRVLEPIRRRMVPGANIALNLTNDSVIKNRFGERSMYLERLTIALHDQLGLHLMERLIWNKPNAAPGPTHFVSKLRTHLNSKYEPILILNTSPEHNLADNRRILQPYSENMKKLIAAGGEKRTRDLADSGHRVKKGSFARDNGGSVAGNVLTIANTCANKRLLLAKAKELGLPPHNATFPVTLAETLIKFLCPIDGLVADPFGGWSTVGYAAEKNGYRWVTNELHWEYVRAAIERFPIESGLSVNPLFAELDDMELRHKFAS